MPKNARIWIHSSVLGLGLVEVHMVKPVRSQGSLKSSQCLNSCKSNIVVQTLNKKMRKQLKYSCSYSTTLLLGYWYFIYRYISRFHKRFFRKKEARINKRAIFVNFIREQSKGMRSYF